MWFPSLYLALAMTENEERTSATTSCKPPAATSSGGLAGRSGSRQGARPATLPHYFPRPTGSGVPGRMRALNSLTQNLIDNLTQILQNPEEDALQTLRICAPVLIEELQQIQLRAVDRRDIVPQIKQLLDEWLQQHPQPDTAQQALIEAVDRAEILQRRQA